MTQIDWSKAPDWAEAHGLHVTGFGIKEFWLGEAQFQQIDQAKPFSYGGGDPLCGSFHNHRRSSFVYVTERPKPWNGEGLPPVGAFVHVHDNGDLIYGKGESGEVLAHVEDCAVIRMSYGLGCFRAECLRTAEQIAADDRLAAIAKMSSDARLDFSAGELLSSQEYVECAISALYDAGYRKQVTE